jgi:hypothetical protein
MKEHNIKVYAITDKNDDTFKKMTKIWHMCRDESVELPSSVEKYFRGDIPTDRLKMELNINYHADETGRFFTLRSDEIPDDIDRIVVNLT